MIFYGAIAVPLLVIDVLLLAELPRVVTRFYSGQELFSILGGAVACAISYLFIHKPERLYLWGHELTHLVVAKLFLKQVHGFHITSRAGGKVIIDGTNVWIDLAPYIFPFYSILFLAGGSLFRPVPPWGTTAYLVGAAFLYSMHLAFSVEGFLDGQPDLKRSGRFFSFAVVLLFLEGFGPFLLAPGAGWGWGRVAAFYGQWWSAAADTGRRLFLAGWRLLF
jgi:hypothetical protein